MLIDYLVITTGWSDPASHQRNMYDLLFSISPLPYNIWNKTKCTISSSALVDELDRLLTVADVPLPRVIVGWSFGGAIAQLYASRFHQSVLGVVRTALSCPSKKKKCRHNVLPPPIEGACGQHCGQPRGQSERLFEGARRRAGCICSGRLCGSSLGDMAIGWEFGDSSSRGWCPSLVYPSTHP